VGLEAEAIAMRLRHLSLTLFLDKEREEKSIPL
jgi:hypothetical protein